MMTTNNKGCIRSATRKQDVSEDCKSVGIPDTTLLD